MATVITDERCLGFPDLGNQYKHNTKIRITTDIINLPDGTVLRNIRKWCPDCDQLKEDSDDQGEDL